MSAVVNRSGNVNLQSTLANEIFSFANEILYNVRSNLDESDATLPFSIEISDVQNNFSDCDAALPSVNDINAVQNNINDINELSLSVNEMDDVQSILSSELDEALPSANEMDYDAMQRNASGIDEMPPSTAYEIADEEGSTITSSAGDVPSLEVDEAPSCGSSTRNGDAEVHETNRQDARLRRRALLLQILNHGDDNTSITSALSSTGCVSPATVREGAYMTLDRCFASSIAELLTGVEVNISKTTVKKWQEECSLKGKLEPASAKLA
jgi:hypothetical protein